MATTESVTALKTTVESLNTTVAAITETVNTTKTGLSALTELTSQHTANINSLSEQVTATVSQNYKFVTKFENTDGHQNTICTWVMEGCYLTQAQPEDGENGNHDAQLINCGIRFDNANLYDYDGTLITGDGAVSTLMSKVLAF